MERAKQQAATKLVSQAGKNVSCKTGEPAQLKAFSCCSQCGSVQQ